MSWKHPAWPGAGLSSPPSPAGAGVEQELHHRRLPDWWQRSHRHWTRKQPQLLGHSTSMSGACCWWGLKHRGGSSSPCCASNLRVSQTAVVTAFQNCSWPCKGLASRWKYQTISGNTDFEKCSCSGKAMKQPFQQYYSSKPFLFTPLQHFLLPEAFISHQSARSICTHLNHIIVQSSVWNSLYQTVSPISFFQPVPLMAQPCVPMLRAQLF